ncbi:MAG TPA: SDR family NAD(P)-dependent oxidoreductase [Burkholderiaceae bacterium]|nr:SDR family NAD(P)-dependent oxidoreductase [Burkholderiaceae bacterium]
MTRPVALVVGVGAEVGVGAAVSRRFAAGGHHVIVAGRTAAKIERVAQRIRETGGSAEAFVVDATDEAQVIRLFDHGETPDADRGPLDAVVFNAGNNREIALRELTAEQFQDYWRVGCYAGFLVGREAARRLTPRGRGTLIFTGASGSLRGKARYAHFAVAKAGLRVLAQSIAREFGPQGLHVAHVVIDGGIRGDRLLSRAPQLAEQRGTDGLLEVDAIAENYWNLYRQPRSAWTLELDLRPFKEPF